jgi:hypothetical protein
VKRLADLATFPPVGTRCFYRNEALKLEGWGEIVEPRDEIDAAEIPLLVPWKGALTGPLDPGQVALNQVAPGCGVLPKEGYQVVAAILLWVNQ